METACRSLEILFDKTGTLTTGRPRLAANPANQVKPNSVLLALASASRHQSAAPFLDSLDSIKTAQLENIAEFCRPRR